MTKWLWIIVAAPMVSSPAFAHTHLATSSPADGGMLAADAKEILLSFDGLIKEATCSATDSAGKTVAGFGAAKAEREEVHVPVDASVAKGAYALACHYKGVDGHEMNATVKFTIAR